MVIGISTGEGAQSATQISTQLLDIAATFSDATGTATIEVALYNGDPAVAAQDGVIRAEWFLADCRASATSATLQRRAAADNSSGNYVGNVASSITGRRNFDCLGIGKVLDVTTPSAPTPERDMYVLVGVRALSAGTVDVYVTTSRVI
jgi:hypothetical protein